MTIRRLPRSTVGSIVIVGFAAAIFFVGRELRSRTARAQAACEDLRVCQSLAHKLARLRRLPNQAALRATTAGELSRRIESAAQAAGIAPASVIRIDPEPLRRVGDTSYREQETRVELGPVELRQLVAFLTRVGAGEDGLAASAIRLSAPRREASQEPSTETWQAEVTLTQLVFAPKS